LPLRCPFHRTKKMTLRRDRSKVATGDEGAVRTHEQRRDIVYLIRGARPSRWAARMPC
jgi:hypothetical protein